MSKTQLVLNFIVFLIIDPAVGNNGIIINIEDSYKNN